MIPEAERDQARRDAEEFLPASCVIQTLTLTSDGAGGQVEDWTDGAPVACRFAPIISRGASGSIIADRISEGSTHVFTLPWDAAISLESQIVCENRTWTVTAIPERDTDTTFVRRAEVKEVK